MVMAMLAEKSSSPYFCLICSNEIQVAVTHCPLDDTNNSLLIIKCQEDFITNDYQQNEGVLIFSDAYGHTEVKGTHLIVDNEFGNNTMSISANEIVTYDQSPSTTVDKTPNVPWKKKKNKKVKKDIILVLNHELLNLNDEPLKTVRSVNVLTASYRMHHLAQLWEETDNCDNEMRDTI
ncbi:10860_t:CDS:2 [Rhizophagus irregularis]|nr:10860_t:CDS:2 [Rhizophagus irregularis]